MADRLVKEGLNKSLKSQTQIGSEKSSLSWGKIAYCPFVWLIKRKG